MFSPWFSPLRTAVWTTAALLLVSSAGQSLRAQAPTKMTDSMGYGQASPSAPASSASKGGQARNSAGMTSSSPVLTPGLFEVVCPAGCYGGAFHVFGCRAYAGAGYYGFFHRYWGYGTYGPSYYFGANPPQSGLGGGDLYVAIRRGHGLFKHGGAASSSVACAAEEVGVPPVRGEANPPAPAANTARLQILVPENAEVLVEGSKTSMTGTVRDFISPPLIPEKNMTYTITVRYPDAGGKTVEETHSIRVRANDQLRIDCTKPTSSEQPRATVLRP